MKQQVMEAEDLYALIRSGRAQLQDIANLSGYTERSIKSFMYGERKVPAVVAKVAWGIASGRAVVDREAPWWANVLDRAARIAESELRQNHDELRKAIDTFCAACEPAGLCRKADCELRGVSPLPLLVHKVRRVA